jgi:hypothetical protein
MRIIRMMLLVLWLVALTWGVIAGNAVMIISAFVMMLPITTSAMDDRPAPAPPNNKLVRQAWVELENEIPWPMDGYKANRRNPFKDTSLTERNW